MSVDLVPTITRAGFAACRNAQGSGLLAAIDRIAVGRGTVGPSGYVGYKPTGREVALKGEMTRVPIIHGTHLGGVAGSDPIGFRVLAEVPALVPPAASYPINEVGFLLADGTLLALWSSASDVLHFMTQHAPLEMSLDLLLSVLPVASMTINVLRPDVPDTTGVLAMLLAASANHLIGQINDEWRLPLTPRPGV